MSEPLNLDPIRARLADAEATWEAATERITLLTREIAARQREIDALTADRQREIDAQIADRQREIDALTADYLGGAS